MTTLALLGDPLRRRARGVNIGCFLNVEGCLAHAVHILLPFSWDALNRVEVPPLPVYPFASLGPDKPDARDTLSLLEWDPDLTAFAEIAGPFDVER